MTTVKDELLELILKANLPPPIYESKQNGNMWHCTLTVGSKKYTGLSFDSLSCAEESASGQALMNFYGLKNPFDK